MSLWTKRRDRSLRVSAYLPNWTNGVAAGEQPSWPELVTTARSLEEIGLDGIWVADQMLQEFEDDDPLAFWESWTVISALAPLTEELTLGPLVSSASFRNPGLLANMAGTLAEITGGRVALGLGAGYDENEHRAFGLPWANKVSRLAEAAAILDDLLGGATSNREGDHYSTRGARLVPERTVPLVIGTYSPGARMLRIVAEHADAWSAWLAFDLNSPEVVREQWEALQRACADIDRDAGTIHRLACVSVQLTREPFRFGPIDLAEIAIGGEARAIADRLLTFEDVADEVVIYSYPLTARALETIATVLEALED